MTVVRWLWVFLARRHVTGVPGAAYCCEICGGDHLWSVLRRGDVVISWACPAHLSEVCDRLQRDHEITKLVITHSPKAREWAEIGEVLRKVDWP